VAAFAAELEIFWIYKLALRAFHYLPIEKVINVICDEKCKPASHHSLRNFKYHHYFISQTLKHKREK
jgi:hypothetical protein